MNPRSSILLAAAAGVAFGYGIARVPQWLGTRPDTVPTDRRALVPQPGHQLLDEVVARVRREYVEQVPDAAFDQAAVKGVIANLDPHSAFLDAAEYDEMRALTAGSYTGVGLEVAAADGRVVVVAPIEGSPAARAGVKPGDVVLAVNDEPVAADRLGETIGRMRGVTGTQVRLAVRRQGESEPLLFTLERGEVQVQSVRAESLPGDFGYVRITQFNDSTPDDLVAALSSLVGRVPHAKFHPLRGLVLDLRGNPGGVLESAVGVADTFLDDGVIVRADGRTPESSFAISATPGDALDGQPLVVLVDGGSASGSEIVAGALRDHGRATLMGERTFGKGSVQTVIPLRDGQALKLTTSRYVTPAGTSIHERGLEPDIAIGPLDGEQASSAASAPLQDAAVLTALQYLRDRGLGARYAAAKSSSTAQQR